jgi:general secretion pathway protein D
VTTTIRLRDGETNMLAGLIRDEERKVLNGVPGLSDIPVIGRLFAANSTESKQTDIILVITPHVVRVLELTEADLRPFRIGREPTAGVVESPAPQADVPEPGETPATQTAPAPATAQPILPPPTAMPKPPVKPPPGL